jgi:aryl sulfotransferase
MPRPDVVWLASYPKSGNTWLRILIANYFSGLDLPAGINSSLLPAPEFRSRAAFDDLTLLESGMLTGDEVESLLPPVYADLTARLHETAFCKIHDAYVCNADGVPLHSACRAVVYILRDPRDVAVSLAHHLGATVDAAIAGMNSSHAALAQTHRRQHPQLRQRLLDWSGHVRSWCEQRDAPVHLVRYEDMKRDTASVFAGILEFAGLSATPSAIRRAVQFSSFSELQRQERSQGFREKLAQSNGPFFRQGEAGAWRNSLTAAQAASIVAAHGATMSRFGYDVSLAANAALTATAPDAYAAASGTAAPAASRAASARP